MTPPITSKMTRKSVLTTKVLWGAFANLSRPPRGLSVTGDEGVTHGSIREACIDSLGWKFRPSSPLGKRHSSWQRRASLLITRGDQPFLGLLSGLCSQRKLGKLRK